MDKTEFEAAYAAGVAQRQPFVIGVTPIALVPEGYMQLDLERCLPEPARIRETVGVSDVKSFVLYWKDYHTATSKIFADESKSQIAAVLDYHGDIASWCTHRLVLTLNKSREWLVWRGKHGTGLTQEQFADFLEDNLADITAPDAASVLEAASHLEANKTVKFKSGINLDSGAVQFTYDEAVEGKGRGTLKVPNRFTVGIPIMAGQDPTAIEVRLRYRISADGVLSFIYKLDNPGRLLEQQFEAITEYIGRACDCEAYLGSI